MVYCQVTTVLLKGLAPSHAPQECSGLPCKTERLQMRDAVIKLALAPMERELTQHGGLLPTPLHLSLLISLTLFIYKEKIKKHVSFFLDLWNLLIAAL